MTPPVTLRITAPIAQVTMADVEGRNALGPRLYRGLERVLPAAADDPEVKAIVVTGLPDIFCSGAPRDVLLETDGTHADDYEKFTRIFARCPLPVVAAMNGHAIGGGLVFGLYADVPVLSERCVYAANFLQYGIAPYLGTTHIVPSRMGESLGTEMIFTARGYRGAELRSRGAPVLILPHDRVHDMATTIATRIARAPRRSIELVKQQLARRVLAETDTAMAVELEPHLASMELAAVRERVATGYGPPTSMEVT
ncbi:polyketide synthase [Amycolatopsis alba]|uniref:polyketide synthase n=1 Tax=Amycolatopsis alba TaxID=76020 RepID=UPI0003798FB8|nr:polyketide synthase [Amycolatopsis alba]